MTGFCWAGDTLCRAQTAITAIATSTSDLANTVTNGTTFEHTTISVTSLTTATTTYSVAANAISAAVRRNNVNSTNSSAWHARGTPVTQFRAPYATDYASLLLGNNILRGSDNTFANGATVSDGNIERLDFILSNSGVAATADMAFAIFDRGAAGAHDVVKIAHITSLGTITVNSVTYTNAPTNYAGNLVSVVSTSYGANIVPDFSYNIFRHASGNNLSTWASTAAGGPQGLAGTVVNLSDFNVAPGTTIYDGYSLFAGEVTTGGNITNLADWSSATFYPANSSGAGAGGVDLAALNGVQFKNNAPEPATYGLIFVGAMVALVALRRRRRSLFGQARAVRRAVKSAPAAPLFRERFQQRKFPARSRSDELTAKRIHARTRAQQPRQRRLDFAMRSAFVGHVMEIPARLTRLAE